MKRIGVFLIILLLFACIWGCVKNEDGLLDPGFSTRSFFNIKESGRPLTDRKMAAVIAKIPSKQYESYPSMQNMPLSATLYKDGEVIAIDVSDPRLIRLVNFFNNALYYEKCAYVQSYLSPERLSNVTAETFRLELTYTAYGEVAFGPYESNTTLCDTMIITNSNDGGFYLINHDLQAYGGEYSVLAAGYVPLFNPYPWLNLFGF